MGHNKSIWFNSENYEYIEKKAKKEKVSFNKTVNDVIKKEKEEKEKKHGDSNSSTKLARSSN